MYIPKKFSKELEEWLKSDRSKTVADLIEVFDEKSFAVCLLILMFIPSLPLPTGGLTHVFEAIAVLLSLEMILGRQAVWLPQRWKIIDISGLARGKVLASLIKRLKWLEKYSRPRFRGLLKDKILLRVTGFIITLFTLTAFLAPPFSGLDTLPSLAVVIIALSLIVEDIALYIVGLFVGVVGIATVLILGDAVLLSIKHLF